MKNVVYREKRIILNYSNIGKLWLTYNNLLQIEQNIFSKSLLKGGLLFFKNSISYSLYLNYLKQVNKFNPYLKLKEYRIILFSGLGYKRKIFKRENILFTYIADRHWILFRLNQKQTIFPIRRRNFFILGKTKNSFLEAYNFFCRLRKPYVYKMKGFLDIRIKQRFLFVRRIRLRGIKTKLSKKQMLL